MSTHSFYFKMVYTCQTINYDINLDMSIAEFINYVKDKIRVDFNIDTDPKQMHSRVKGKPTQSFVHVIIIV